jgi:two-component system cell cycle response regulator
MTARVLVVDDILANVRLLEAKLTAEYFDVLTAMNGIDAVETVQRARPDIVLLDVMMPGIDGIEVCKRIKSNPMTQHIPVIMVTALDQPEDRVRGLEAGADDFLTKPVNDLALFCRVKSLVRLKMLTDELRARSDASELLSLAGSYTQDTDRLRGSVLVIDNRPSTAERLVAALASRHDVEHVDDPQAAVTYAAERQFELIIVSLDIEHADGLRICSQLKSMEATRQTPILIVVDPDDHDRLLKALDMGVNDYLIRPIDRQELMARANTQVRRCRYAAQLRSNVQATIEMAVTDPLTGLYNRRFMESQLGPMVEHGINRGKQLSVLALDVDFFKAVNDSHGHDVGDRVLQEVAARLRNNVRNVDLVCRVGGEEFIIILPDTDGVIAMRVAERIRKAIASKPFNSGARTGPLSITLSIGIACIEDATDTTNDLLKRADQALYRAKREGRNRVAAEAA